MDNWTRQPVSSSLHPHNLFHAYTFYVNISGSSVFRVSFQRAFLCRGLLLIYISSFRATCPAHPNVLDCTIHKILGDVYKSWLYYRFNTLILNLFLSSYFLQHFVSVHYKSFMLARLIQYSLVPICLRPSIPAS